MRRKNRQLKITVDIPDLYEDDEAFMVDLQNAMDGDVWELPLGWAIANEASDCDFTGEAKISKIVLGEIEIGPEEE